MCKIFNKKCAECGKPKGTGHHFLCETCWRKKKTRVLERYYEKRKKEKEAFVTT